MAHPGDASAIASIYAPSVTDAATSFELVPPSAEEIAARIAQILVHAPWIVFTRRGEVVGFAYASRHRDRPAYQWSVDTSVYVRAELCRAGIGRALYTSLLTLLRLQGFYAAHAGITLPNPGSVALHEAMGFRPIGAEPSVGYKLGAWHDVSLWQLALRERAAAPAPPLPLRDAEARPGWAEALGKTHPAPSQAERF
jgi:phosphinothricin acetyltransferase